MLDHGPSVEEATTQWGASTFVSTARRRLRCRELGSSIPLKHINFLLLGPAGVGKSSLVHTAWRALSGSRKSDPGLLERLQVGWTAAEAEEKATASETPTTPKPKPGGLRAKHGTTALRAYALQSRLAEKTVKTSVFAQDSKGQQFYDDDERSFAEKLVSGILKNGSSAERESVYFWAVAARLGLGRFVKTAAIAHSPHAVVLVFDVTLRSFRRAIDGNDDALADCYRRVADHATTLGLTLFAVLTHIDVYEKKKKSIQGQADDDEKHDDETTTRQQQERRVGEAVAADLDDFRHKLSHTIGDHILPPTNVFPIVNYNVDANDKDDAVELAALDFLTTKSLQHHVSSSQGPRCRLS
mmetsp:Transcript_27156/g.87749  ORF Transcript_27156/g.87749 Transcript_27156/m.87749 type:complete len:356 (+) Transcript_27156:26-1093(+)